MFLRWSALAGVTIPVVWWPVVLVEGATRPGYDAFRHSISRLALGDDGWSQSTLFVVTGVLHMLFAYALATGLPRPLWSWLAPALIALRGIAYVLLAVFPTSPGPGVPTLSGTVHLYVGFAGVIAFVLASFVVVPRLRGWPGYVWYSLLSGLLVTILGLVSLVFAGPNGPFAGDAGLIQRLQFLFMLLWPFVIGLRLARRPVMRPATAM